jgi:DNA repair exonuclease SbcCD ATPase subunit
MGDPGPDDAGDGPGSDGSPAEFAGARARAEERLRSLRTRERELLVVAGSRLERYEKEWPGLAREMDDASSALRRAERFEAATKRAIDELRALSRETYAEWSGILNTRAGRLLDRLGPGYGALRFEEDLGFSLQDSEGRRYADEDVRERFSLGTRDQVHLAVRLALGEYVSREGDPLPLVLDDPLTAADDERFARAMEFILGDLARERQVILLTCHEGRHRALADARPELFRGVAITDLSALGPSRDAESRVRAG